MLAVQRMLGHEDAGLTLNTYADLFPDDLEAVSGKLDEARTTALAGKSRTTSEEPAR
ncbi:hypothetical protein [Tsukamurella asaccharolytica]|uniref:hypothetical protein n=1 Tax=Tsukamurella asaccharolytica TaxID=2592067 RepID=UPI0013155317